MAGAPVPPPAVPGRPGDAGPAAAERLERDHLRTLGLLCVEDDPGTRRMLQAIQIGRAHV
jgi:hypothetical protein